MKIPEIIKTKTHDNNIKMGQRIYVDENGFATNRKGKNRTSLGWATAPPDNNGNLTITVSKAIMTKL